VAFTDVNQSRITLINLESKVIRHILHEFDLYATFFILEYISTTTLIYLEEGNYFHK
jgi:hypothetical protein